MRYHNLMEDIVLQHVDALMQADGCCPCEICRSDVVAYTLNHLPPHYVSSDTGRMMVKLQSYEAQFRTDVITALSTAVKLVHDHPRHS